MVDKFPTDVKLVNKYDFLAKPTIGKKPIWLAESRNIWANMYKLTLRNQLNIREYSVTFHPQIEEANTDLKKRLYGKIEKEVKEKFGEICIFTGDCLFSAKEVDPIDLTFVYHKTKVEYTISILRTKSPVFLLNDSFLNNRTNASKMLYELIVREVVRANPNVEFYRDIFVKTKEKQILKSKNSGDFDFFPGYTTGINFLQNGVYLNIGIKNKIIMKRTCLQVIRQLVDERKKTTEEVSEAFSGRSVKTTYSKRNYIVDAVNFARKPSNSNFVYKGGNVNLVEYYKKAHGVAIKDVNQPLLEVGQKDGGVIYLVPELCLLTGVDDDLAKDRDFMVNLAQYTKLDPSQKVKTTADFFNIINDNGKKVLIDKQTNEQKVLKSAKETKDEVFGLEIKYTADSNITGHIIKETQLMSKNKQIDPKKFPVHKDCLSGGKMLVVYNNKHYEDAERIISTLQKAGGQYKLATPQVEWCETYSFKSSDWIQAIEAYKLSDYKLVLVIIDGRQDRLYRDIKKHAMSTKGYVTQAVKVETMRKNNLSIASKLLLQMNCKLGGYSYVFDQVKDMKDLMVVGADSSHISGKRTGFALSASIDKDFSEYYNSEYIIEEKNKVELAFCISKFLEQAIKEYFKRNKALPKGVVIYRQGVSRDQTVYLAQEVSNINGFLNGDSYLKGVKIPYYYVLVNKKTNFKFFECGKGSRYENPKSGLLIMDTVTDNQYFEFFLQPQQVTQGSATPTHFHVAYGTMDSPEVVYKLTFDLCSIYPNWQGPVRVPSVLKLCEKLSKMVAKYTKSALNPSLERTLCYL